MTRRTLSTWLLVTALAGGVVPLVPTSASSETVPAATVHPRLLFSAADVPALRARVAAGGAPGAAWKLVHEKAEGHLVRVQPEIVRAEQGDPIKDTTNRDLQGLQRPYGLQGEMTSYLVELGLAYQISGDPRYGRHAIELLRALSDAGWPIWTGGDDLGLGDLNMGLGLAFDWTYELMTSEERSEIVRSITAHQDKLFVRALFEYTNEASEYKISNWSGIMGGGTGLLLLAIRGEPDAPSGFDSPAGPAIPQKPAGTIWPARHYEFDDYLQKAILKAGNYFRFGFDALGAGHEGHTYAHYGLDRAIPFAMAVKREGLADLLTGTGARNIARWKAFEQLPGEGHNMVNINDSARTMGGVGLEALMFAIAPDNGVAQWNWRRTVGEMGEDYYGDAHIPAPLADDICPLDRWAEAPLVSAACPALLHIHSNAWTILYYRTPAETPEVDPAIQGPLSVHYGVMGLVDARTGFARESGEVVSTFQARRNAREGHFQYDGGNFTLYGEGARWAIDPGSACVGCGYPYGQGPPEGYPTFHNTIVIDGSPLTQSNYSRYYDGVTVDNFLNAPNVSLTHADMRYAYSRDPNAFFDSPFAGRDHLFSRVPGRPVVVGIADELERDAVPFPRRYQWQMITDRANVATAEGAGFTIKALNGATLVGRSARNVNPTTAALPATDPTFAVEPIFFSNATDDYGPHYKISTSTAPQQKLEQVTLMAITPAGVQPATTMTLRLGGANAVAVDWAGTREVFLRRVRSASTVTGEVETDARIARFVKDQGELVMRDGRRLSAYGRDYVTVTGSPARVVVSGSSIAADGAGTNSYRVFAPKPISSVTVNGNQVSSCREGLMVAFPCRLPTTLAVTAPSRATATDPITASMTLTTEGTPLSNRMVTLRVGDHSAYFITDAVGGAQLTLPLDVDAGEVTITATFAGDNQHLPSTGTASVTVVPDATILTLTEPPRAKGEIVEVSALLFDDDPLPLAAQPVVVQVGAVTATVLTDSAGQVRAALAVPDHGRAQDVLVTYAGSARYAPAQVASVVHWGSGNT